ncbi:MAG: nucleoside deaminase [Legionellales bacterium]|nr:nucleoside deaminase [Legionellales bacterium]
MSNFHNEHETWMSEAFALAKYALSIDEVPVGAVIVKDDKIIGRGWNSPIDSCDPTCHAEINAIRDAARNLGNYRIIGAVMYVTFEPCIMCLGAIQQARLSQIIFGATDNTRVKRLQGLSKIECCAYRDLPAERDIFSESCSDILSNFFKDKR